MTDADKPRFAALMTGLADYYGQQLSRIALDVYWDGLRQFDFAAIERATKAHTQLPDDSGHWMPKISDVKKMLEGRTEDQAQLAWSKVDSAVRQIGIWEDVAFDDPVIHRVLADMGGWIRMCSHEDKEWPFVAKEFVTRYRGFKISGQTPEYPRYLLGTSSAHNNPKGLGKLAVRLIGNPMVARRVIKGGLEAHSVLPEAMPDMKRIERSA
jgi:hypothetical protein